MLSKKVYIWCNDNYNALGLLRQLKDFTSDLNLIVRNNENCATISKYCKSYKRIRSLEEGLVYLRSLDLSTNNRAILLSTSDLIAEFIEIHSNILSGKYIISKTNANCIQYYLDKYNMGSLAEICGFNVPKTDRYSRNIDFAALKYPCIVKPARKYANIPTLFKTFKCETTDEFRKIATKLNEGDNYIVQEYINKEYEVLVYGCTLSDGSLYLPGAFIKYRWSNGGDGSFGELVPNIPKCIDIQAIKMFIDKSGYKGLFSFEFGISKDKAYFYETNFRNDGTSHYFYQAGANVPFVWTLDTCGLPYKNKIGKVRKTIFIDEFNDFDNVKNGEINKIQWKSDYRKAQAFKYYDASDLKPYYFRKTRNVVYKLLKPLIKFVKNVKLSFKGHYKNRD